LDVRSGRDGVTVATLGSGPDAGARGISRRRRVTADVEDELASATLGAGTRLPVVALHEESGGGGEMADFDEVREQYHRALETYILGDPGPVMGLWSTRDDVTLANPIGPPVRGWDGVREAAERAASQLRDGDAFSLECISA